MSNIIDMLSLCYDGVLEAPRDCYLAYKNTDRKYNQQWYLIRPDGESSEVDSDIVGVVSNKHMLYCCHLDCAMYLKCIIDDDFNIKVVLRQDNEPGIFSFSEYKMMDCGAVICKSYDGSGLIGSTGDTLFPMMFNGLYDNGNGRCVGYIGPWRYPFRMSLDGSRIDVLGTWEPYESEKRIGLQIVYTGDLTSKDEYFKYLYSGSEVLRKYASIVSAGCKFRLVSNGYICDRLFTEVVRSSDFERLGLVRVIDTVKYGRGTKSFVGVLSMDGRVIIDPCKYTDIKLMANSGVFYCSYDEHADVIYNGRIISVPEGYRSFKNGMFIPIVTVADKDCNVLYFGNDYNWHSKLEDAISIKQSKTQNDVYIVNVYGANIAVNSHYEPIMLIGTIDCANDFVDLKF